MKKIFIITTGVILTLISSSCEENFSPKTDFVQQYALFCIVNGDTTYQSAFIEKSYNVEGLDPSVYEGNPFVEDAEVSIEYEGGEYLLRDSTMQIGNNEVQFFYTDDLKPDAGKEMKIRAGLPDGNVLTGSTTTPKSGNLSFQYQDVSSDTYIEQKSEGLFFIWHISGNDTAGILYLPKLIVNYYKMESVINVK